MSTLNSTRHWLSIRIRVLCVVAFATGSLLPPYVPSAAMAPEDSEIASQQFLLVEEGFLMKSSSLTQQGARRAYAEGIIHTVKDGDSLQRLSEKYAISVDTIRWANSLTENSPIQPGQELIILPVDGVLHTVSRGQTLSRIAQMYDIPQEEIMEQNKLQGSFIMAGQQVIVPGGKPIVPVVVAVTEQPAQPTPAQPTQPRPPTPAPAQPAQASVSEPTTGVLQMPCENCFYTQYFHGGHYAVDIQTKGGGPIFAAEAGTVIQADYGWNGGYGNVIEVDHGNGLVTLYGHNKELYVEVGDKVERGQTIAWMGNTGLVYGKTGIHTHFEVHLNGVKKNPLLYLE